MAFHPLAHWTEFIGNPIKLIDETLGITSNATTESMNQFHVGLSDMLSRLPSDKLADIPLLNDCNRLKNGSLVRFKCMVQDMFDPEFYLSSYDMTDCATGCRSTGYGLYRNSLSAGKTHEIDFNSNKNIMMDRTSYLCISIPGESEWVKSKRCEKEDQPMETASEPGTDPVTPAGDTEPNAGSENQSNQSKSLKEDKEAMANIRTKLKQCFPDTEPKDQKVAFVKVYDSRDLGIKLNEMIEVIGIIDIGESVQEVDVSKNESTNGSTGPTEVPGVGEELDSNHFSLPAVVAPQIHALHVKRIQHLNPLTDSLLSDTESTMRSHQEFCERMRKELHAVLSLCLFDDELAAEYLICSLVSRIYSRQDTLNLGSLAVGFSHLPKVERSEMQQYIRSLYQLLSRLVTHSVYLPLSLTHLNRQSFVPRKDNVSNKLVSGVLQLPAETLLFVDETALETGKLEEQGIRNMRSLTELIKWQQLKYDFEYHSLEVNTDMKVLVFSEGKSLLPLNFRVPLEVPKEVNTGRVMEAVNTYLSEQMLNQIREYLTGVRITEFHIPSSVQQQIQKDFVEMRQMDSKNVTADSLHSLLTLSRLMSISRGDRELKLETWDTVMRMEAARVARQSKP